MEHPTARVAAPAATLLLLIFTFSSQLSLLANAATTVGFYGTSCPRAEAIVQQVVQARFASDPTVTAGLLRMFFHDCFVTVSHSPQVVTLISHMCIVEFLTSHQRDQPILNIWELVYPLMLKEEHTHCASTKEQQSFTI